MNFSDTPDYRDYLKEYYDRRKSEMPLYSYRMMGDKLGLDSSYLYRVLQHFYTHNRPALIRDICILAYIDKNLFDRNIDLHLSLH